MSGMSDTIVYVQTKSPKCPDCYVLTKFSSQKRPRNVRTFKFFTSQKKQGLFVVRFSALLVNVRTFLSNVRILFWNVFGMRTLFLEAFLREELCENCMQPSKGFALGKAWPKNFKLNFQLRLSSLSFNLNLLQVSTSSFNLNLQVESSSWNWKLKLRVES